MISQPHLHPTNESAKKLYQRQIKGPVVMLNLLRFRKEADYTATPELAPLEPISGAEAYRIYMKHTAPFLEQAGGEVLFSGRAADFLIGPIEEYWDGVLMIKQQSVSAFFDFAQNEAYLAGLGHRTAALEDSRLLPITEGKVF